MIAANLPTGGPWGWAVAGENLKREFAKSGKVAWVSDATACFPDALVATRSEPPVLQAVAGCDFTPSAPWLWSSKRNTGYFFIEDYETAAKFKGNAIQWDTLVAGSTWASEMMKDRLGIDCPVVIQGVDTERFQPMPQFRQSLGGGGFVIFSGGKFEYRKGQDLVIAAFKVLCERYDDVSLGCSWGNLWPATMNSMFKSEYIQFKPGNANLPNSSGVEWIRETMSLNGIPPERYKVLPLIVNKEMALMYNQADVAVFPNRCEAGTNLPLMECMACGVPVIATYATGHKDVVPENVMALYDNQERENGWVEPSLDELIESLDRAYRDRSRLQEQANICRDNIQRFTWAKAAEQLIEITEGKETTE